MKNVWKLLSHKILKQEEFEDLRIKPGVKPDYKKFLKLLEQKLEAFKRTAQDKQSKYQDKMKKHYDKSHAPHTFSVGDIVKIYTKDITKAHKSIIPYWRAPYRIVRFPDPNGVTMEVVEYPSGNEETETEIVHVNNVEPYNLPKKVRYG